MKFQTLYAVVALYLVSVVLIGASFLPSVCTIRDSYNVVVDSGVACLNSDHSSTETKSISLSLLFTSIAAMAISMALGLWWRKEAIMTEKHKVSLGIITALSVGLKAGLVGYMVHKVNAFINDHNYSIVVDEYHDLEISEHATYGAGMYLLLVGASAGWIGDFMSFIRVMAWNMYSPLPEDQMRLADMTPP